jgi:MoaA/NifB/PqqE/SkfB family radical SAM enzyme
MVADPSLSREIICAAHRWFAGEIGLADLRAIEATLPQRRNLALVVNNECNLKCAHCFLQIPRLSHTRLTTAEWGMVLNSAVREDIGQYVIVGKEVLLGNVGPEVVSLLGGIRKQRPCMRTGLVTNGTLLHKHFERIETCALTHMDVSMEGAEPDHDAIRGSGAFAAVRPNVQWAANLLRDRLFVTLTLQKRNLTSLDEALLTFAALGVRSVGISPFERLPYNDPSLTLSGDDFRAFFAGLNRLEGLSFPHEMFVQVDACVLAPEALLSFMESEWFDLDSMKMDGTGFLYSSYRMDNGVTLSFRYLPWPLTLEFSTRISADGEVLAVADGHQARAYSVHSLANVRDFDFDFGAAFRAASNHPRIALLDRTFEEKLAPAVRKAYRGWFKRKHTFYVPVLAAR